MAGGSLDAVPQQDYEDTTDYRVNNGVPIDGIGMQGHFSNSPTGIARIISQHLLTDDSVIIFISCNEAPSNAGLFFIAVKISTTSISWAFIRLSYRSRWRK